MFKMFRSESDKEDTKKPIKVYARVRPLNDDEVEREEQLSVETFEDGKRIKIIDKKHSQETTYYFDGVFAGTDPNKKVFEHTTRSLLTKLLNGMNVALLTYGQTGSGKTFTLMADGCITEFAIIELFQKIAADKKHKYKITCSFVQVYLEKVFDLLNPEKKEELPVREHPKKGIYVSNLSHHQATSADDVFELLDRGKQELVTAETKMVRQSSRSHSIFQLCIERRLDIAYKKSPMNDGTYFNPMRDTPEENDLVQLDEDMVLCGKMDICDLAGSERLGKTMVEGINRSEARYINSSLLELGNVIYALSEGRRRHIPFRNSTLTRLLQECLGSSCQTSFIVCVAPSASEAYETRCSLNFGTRARTITNKERMCINVEVDYKLLAKKLTKKIELLENELGEARPIQNFISSSLSNLNVVTASTQTIYQTQEIKFDDQVESINDIKYLVTSCEMLDILIESNENLNQYDNKYDVIKSATTTMFTIATNSINIIKNIFAKKQGNNSEKRRENVNDKTLENDSDMIHDFIHQCYMKMEGFQKELTSLNRNDTNDFFAETSYCLSETCNEVEVILIKILNQSGDISEANKAQHCVYKKIAAILEIEENQENSIEYDVTNTIKTLLHLLQLIQIARGMLDQSKSFSKTRDTVKPCHWSANLEENISSDFDTLTTSSNEDAYFSDFSSLNTSKCSHGQMNKNEIEFIRNSGDDAARLNPPLKVKLNRSHSFKVKGEMEWNLYNKNHANETDVETILPNRSQNKQNSKRKSRVQSMDYPTTRTKRFVHIDDGSSTSLNTTSFEIENQQMKAELIDLEKQYEELTKKYKQSLTDKDRIYEKLTSLQQHQTIEGDSRAIKNTEIHVDDFKYHNNGVSNTYRRVSNSYNGVSDTYTRLETDEDAEVIFRLQNLLKEKDDHINFLENENEKLVNESEESKYENEKQMEEIMLVTNKLQKFEDKSKQQNESKITFFDEVSNICSVLESTKQEPSRRNFAGVEDITSLESELYYMIENSVRFEDALNEINSKVKQYKEIEEEKLEDFIPKPPIKKVIVPKVNCARTPSLVAKRVNLMKKANKKGINFLKREFNDQPGSAIKEIKACRASRIKDLIYEKLKMCEHISKLEKDLMFRDLQHKESKKQIELLVQELNKMDITLNRQCSMLSFSKQTSTSSPNKSIRENSIVFPLDPDDDIAVIEIPEVKYLDILSIVSDDLSIDLPPGRIDLNKKEFENRKYREVEMSFNLKNQEMDLGNENYALQRKVEYLEESNFALLEEIKTLKSTSQDRRYKLQEIREKNNNLIHELEYFKRQATQMQARSDTTRIKLEKRIMKLKDKILSLETFSKKLEDEITSYKKKLNNKSFNDSGLVQDDFE